MAKGTPQNPGLVTVGRVLNTHGVSGQLRVKVYSDVPHRFDSGQTLYLSGAPYHITSSTPSPPDQVILKLHGLDTIDQARALVGLWVYSQEKDAPSLPEGEYFHFQLIGLRVVTQEGEELGRITEILETGSNDVYVVTGGGGEILVPALASVVLEVHPDQELMRVSLPQGLR